MDDVNEAYGPRNVFFIFVIQATKAESALLSRLDEIIASVCTPYRDVIHTFDLDK